PFLKVSSRHARRLLEFSKLLLTNQSQHPVAQFVSDGKAPSLLGILLVYDDFRTQSPQRQKISTTIQILLNDIQIVPNGQNSLKVYGRIAYFDFFEQPLRKLFWIR